MGMMTLIATLTFLVIALNLGGQAYPWNSSIIIGMFCAAAASFLAFVVAENFAQLPVAPMYLFVQWEWRNVPLIIGASYLPQSFLVPLLTVCYISHTLHVVFPSFRHGMFDHRAISYHTLISKLWNQTFYLPSM